MFENYSDLVSIEELCEMLFIGKNVAYELLRRKKIKAFQHRTPMEDTKEIG